MEASQRLAGLTDDLLDATRLQANRLDLRPEPLELGALVRRVVTRTQVTTKRHAIAVTTSTELVLVEADIQRIEQVVANLLSNAVKYSPAGGPIEVTVTLNATAETEAAASHGNGEAAPVHRATGATERSEWVRVAVRDHGIGIPPAQFDRIFRRFGRADNARESGIPGTGLGLYLSRELIERQGGHLWFESAEGSGATFTFELPRWTEPE